MSDKLTSHEKPQETSRQQGELLTKELQESMVETKRITSSEEAEEYLNFVRGLYRDNAAEFKGNKTPEQQEERDFMDLEGRELLEGLRMFIEKFTGSEVGAPEDRESYKLGALEFEDMIQEFTRLYRGMATLTHRLEDGSEKYKSSRYPKLYDMPDSDRLIVATQLFHDFQAHNALRFGAESAGITRTVRKQDAEGEIMEIIKDADKVDTDSQIARIASEQTYRVGDAQHAAAKVSPQQARDLRTQNRALDRDEFYSKLWGARDAFKTLGEEISESPLPGN